MVRLLCPGLLLLLASCAPDWADPTIRVEHISLGVVTLMGTTVDVELSVYNPNPQPLPFEQVALEMRLGDSRAISGTAVFDAPLPPQESVPVHATLLFEVR